MDNIDEAAKCMVDHLPDWLKETVYFGSGTGCSPESFAAAYLFRFPRLHERLRAAHSSGDFDDFWSSFRGKLSPRLAFREIDQTRNTALIPKPKMNSRCWNLPRDIPSGLSKLLEDCRPLVMQVVKGDFSSMHSRKWVQWQPPTSFHSSTDPDMRAHIGSLGLFGASQTPIVEAHDLGRFRDDVILNERVNNIFHAGKNTFVLINAL